MHAAGNCLGTIQARTQVQLALARQQSMIRTQHRLRLTMQHVFGHGGNLGNECAVHAAALGTFGLLSSQNVATRWIRHNFDTSVCFDGCNNISDYNTFEQMLRRCTRTEFSIGIAHRFLCARCARHVIHRFVVFCVSQVSAFSKLLLCQQVMGSTLFIRVYRIKCRRLFGHNMWNPPIEFFPQACEFFVESLPRGQNRIILSLCS